MEKSFKTLLKSFKKAKRSSGGNTEFIRLWQKAKTPSREAKDVQYSFIVLTERERERDEKTEGFWEVEKVITLRLKSRWERKRRYGFWETRGFDWWVSFNQLILRILEESLLFSRKFSERKKGGSFLVIKLCDGAAW